jgi:solute carrier family 25 folate transporter 32
MNPTAVEFLSGLSAGGVTTLVMHPLDLIKVRLQVDTHKHVVGRTIPNLVRDILYHTGQRRVLELYRGIGPNLVGNTFSWGCYFMLYRRFVQNYAEPANGAHYMYCAFTAGSLTGLVTNPIWVLKTRMLSSSATDPGAYSSMLQGARSILVTDGIKGFWRGFTPSLFGVVQASLQFALYDRLKDRHHQKRKDLKSTEPLSTWEYLTISATSKVFATVSMYPYQVVRSRLQIYGAPELYTSVRDVVKKIYLNEGMVGFYKGLSTNLVRVVPATCLTFLVYETTRSKLA